MRRMSRRIWRGICFPRRQIPRADEKMARREALVWLEPCRASCATWGLIARRSGVLSVKCRIALRAPYLARWIGRLLRSQRGVDLASNTSSGQCGQSCLGSASLDAVVKLKPPLPDIRFGGRNDRILNTPVNHRRALPRRNNWLPRLQSIRATTGHVNSVPSARAR
jgi:hypothetical protein